MKNIDISIICILIGIAIIAIYKSYKDKKANPQTEKEIEELNLKNETNEISQTVCIQEQNFTIQDIQEECNKINDRISLTNILLLIIAITLIVIAYCTVQEYLYKKEIINNTNNTINEILDMIN